MSLIKTSALSSVSTVVKIALGFVINKILAVYTGPSGIALIGQFINFTTIVMTFATEAINSGIIKYVAEYRDDAARRSRILSTALVIDVASSVVLSVMIIVLHRQLSLYLLKTEEYGSIFVVLGCMIIFYSLNGFLVAILNGYKDIRKYVTLNITGSAISLLFTVALVVYMGLYGALLSAILAQVAVFAVTLVFIMKSEWFSAGNFTKGCDRESLFRLGKFSLIAITTALTGPVSQIIVRNYIAENISLDDAGYWQGIWSISNVYLTFVTTSLGFYYLPRLSEIRDNAELRREVISAYKLVIPVVAVLAAGVYIFRDLAVRILFTPKFMPMTGLFAYQLLGDVLKIACWLVGYLMVAKAMIRVFIYTEIFFNAAFVLFSMLFVTRFGLVGVTYAFALNYLICLVFMMFFFRKLLFTGETCP